MSQVGILGSTDFVAGEWYWNTIRNHVPSYMISASAGAFVDVFEGQATDEMEITLNGGVLPSDTSKIMVVASSLGFLANGVTEDYTLDLLSSPNKVILNFTPITPLNIAVLFFP